MVSSRPIFLNTVTVSHLVRTVVTVFLVAIVMSQPLVVSKAMTFAQVALVISLFLPSVMAFLVTVAMLYPWFSVPVFPTDKVFLHYVASEEMITIMSSLVSQVKPLHSVSLIMVVVKAMLLPSALILLVVLVLYLAVHGGASEQLFHLVG